jgi:protein-S-isoprenylcysteine O-methyltransferase Ste14
MINGMQICSYLWLTFFAVWMLAALSTKRAAERVDWGRRLYYGIPVVLAYYCMFSMRLDISWLQERILPKTPELAISAIVITILGMALAFWARVYLGRNWSSAPTIKQQRHPIYSGLLLAMAGTFLANGKVRGAVAVLLLWLAWSIKSRMEEVFMTRTFGA